MNTEKARLYELLGDAKPLNYILNSKDSKSNPLLYFDKDSGENGENKALRYAPNQRTPFLEDQDHTARLEHIVFIDGRLTAQPREKALVKFLDLHPGNRKNGGSVFQEINHEEIAMIEMEDMDYELEAMNIAKSMDIGQAESIMRALKPNQVDKMDSASIKRDLRVLARKNPKEFMKLADDPDKDIMNVIGLAIDNKIMWANSNETEVHWMNGKEKDLMFRVPKGEPIEEATVRFLRQNPETYKAIEREVRVNS